MRRLTVSSTTFGLVVIAAAQLPVRDGGWSPAAASALHHLRSVLSDRSRFGVGPMPGAGALGGYRWIVVAPGGDRGEAVAVATVPVNGPCCALAWPEPGTAASRRALLVHDDGTVLTSLLSTEGPDDARVDAMLSPGAVAYAAVLRQPGTAQDGTRWLAIDAGEDPVAVFVVDEHERPVPGVTVIADVDAPRDAACASLEPPCRLPLAIAASDAGGMASLRGPRCEHVRLWLEWEGNHVCSGNVRLEVANRLLRVVVPTAARQGAGERAAIGRLRQIGSAQCAAVAAGCLDVDGDGNGEHLFLAELAGGVPVRRDARGQLGDTRITPPLLPPAFAQLRGGIAEVGGYRFRMWLPGPDGAPVAEAAGGGGGGLAIDARRSTSQWCVYAWPIDAAHGGRAFCYRVGDELLFVQLGPGCCYFGDHGPDVHAAFAPGDDDSLSAPRAVNADGRDGQRWLLYTM